MALGSASDAGLTSSLVSGLASSFDSVGLASPLASPLPAVSLDFCAASNSFLNRSASGVSQVPPTFRVGEADRERLRHGLAIRHIGSHIVHPRPVRADVRLELDVGRQVVVRAHLERLVAAHHETDLAHLLVLQEAHITRATLLPLLRLLVEAEQLRAAG